MYYEHSLYYQHLRINNTVKTSQKSQYFFYVQVHVKSTCNIVFVLIRIEKKTSWPLIYLYRQCILSLYHKYIHYMEAMFHYTAIKGTNSFVSYNLKMFDNSTLYIKIISKGDLTNANKLRKRFAFLRRMLKAWQHRSTNSWNLSLCFSPLLMT